MTIQRQYSLPNCTLVLEGLGDMTAGSLGDPRPLMLVLINAECHLPGQEKPLTGGRDFLENLAAAVSQYAQEVLSGIPAIGARDETKPVRLHRLNENRHRLTLRPADVPPDTGIAAHLSREIDLTTVQLFDLVEAVDQLFADTRTLPDLTLNIHPVSQRYVRRAEPIAKQAVPMAIGTSGLAAAALALSLIPAPQVKQPEHLFPPGATTTTGKTTAAPGASPPPPAQSPATASSTTGTAGSAATSAPTTPPDPAQQEALLSAAPEITDPAEVSALRQQLQDKLDAAWKTRSPITQDLIYRVGVAEDGRLVGYKPVNAAAHAQANQTPLLDLLAIPATGSSPAAEPIAQYKVVFTGTGLLEVAPWKQVMESPISTSPEITAAAQLEEILPKLRRQLLDNWKTEKLTYRQELVYQVKVKPDGTIVSYRPHNQPASNYVQETPLPQVGKLADDIDTTSPESYALFKVVFTLNNRLEITPWRGWRD
jgi:hypothetical protein